MLVLAQIHVDARAELSAEDAIYELKSNGIGIILRRRQLRAEISRSARTRTIDQIHHVLFRFRNLRHGSLGDIAGLPRRQKFFQLRV